MVGLAVLVLIMIAGALQQKASGTWKNQIYDSQALVDTQHACPGATRRGHR